MKRTLTISAVRLVAIGALLFPGITLAATLSIVPQSLSVQSGDIVSVRVLVNSADTAINNVEAALQFPTDYLQVQSISTSGSIFSLWVAQPTLSGTGQVSFNGGLPTPGFTGSGGQICTIVFVAKKPGTATLSFSDASVLANDGLGTDIYKGSNAPSITIASPVSAQAPAQASSGSASTGAAASGASVSSALVVTSATHPDQSEWYRATTAQFAWDVPGGASAVETLLSDSATATPRVLIQSPITSRTVSDIADGTWYFMVRYMQSGSWSPVTEYRINVDATPPVFQSPQISYDGYDRELVVDANATDTLSGVAKYALSIDGETIAAITPDEMHAQYSFPYEDEGRHTATIIAYDAAGNTAAFSTSFSVPRAPLDEIAMRFGSFPLTYRMMIVSSFVLDLVLLIALIIVLCLWQRARSYRRSRARQEQAE